MSTKKPFYADGLRFSCRRCSSCCRHAPGYVFLSYHDLAELCKATRLSRKAFLGRYCRVVDISGFQRVSLTEKPNYDCIFWEAGGCQVYKYRPLQCRSFPFWASHLDSRATWNEQARSCPGINSGELHTCAEITDWLQRKLEEPFIRVVDGQIIF